MATFPRNNTFSVFGSNNDLSPQGYMQHAAYVSQLRAFTYDAFDLFDDQLTIFDVDTATQEAVETLLMQVDYNEQTFAARIFDYDRTMIRRFLICAVEHYHAHTPRFDNIEAREQAFFDACAMRFVPDYHSAKEMTL